MVEKVMDFQATAVPTPPLQDLDQLQPAELFELTWAFRNDGDMAWEGVSLVYTDASSPDATDYPHTSFAKQTQFSLNELGAGNNVSPGDTVYLSLKLTAPDIPGVYLTGWQLQTAAGQRFGPVREMRVIVVAPSAKALDALSYELVEFTNSVKDYNNMQAGQPFTGAWILKNTGINAWSGDFKIIASVGVVASTQDAKFDLMGLPVHNTLRNLSGQNAVASDATVTLNMPFTAPDTPGVYALHWQLTDGAGRPFGGIRWMQIVVTKSNDTVVAPPVETE
ncbi:MAG: hypothetical protein GY938_04865, partial [Ketobacter sp.]|nr:hypothetical protein [Ketobacter sp.]